MPRKPRIEFPGAFYHVFARGNRKQRIFFSKSDYIKYLTLLRNYKERYAFSIYAYALMPNHMHLLIETQEFPLSAIMQGLQQSYTQYYNRKNDQVGHVFQGRYQAVLCDRDPYLLELVRYIHLNPIRSGVVSEPDQYPWTGHSEYIMKTPQPIIDTVFILKQFGRSIAEARKNYVQFILEGMDKESLISEDNKENPASVALSGIEHCVPEVPDADEYAREPRLHLDPVTLVTVLCTEYGIAPDIIASGAKLPDVVFLRRILCYIARIQCRISLKNIAGALNIQEATVSKGVHWVRYNIKYDRNVEKKVREIVELLKNV